MNLEIFAFVLYFVLVLGIGLFFFVRTRKDGDSEKQYFLGGRQMGPWVTALSAQASDMSAWLLMGLPGSVLAFGLGKAWIGIGLAIGTALNWIFVAKRLRKFSKAANDSITLPEYLQNRFLAKTPVLSILTAIVFLVSFTIYVASGFVAGTTVFVSLVPGLTRETAMIIFAAVILLYTFLGGFKAVSWTDFFQGTLMFIALLAVPIVCVLVEDLDPTAVNTVYTNLNDGTEYAFVPNVFSASWQDIISGLAWGLGYFGMPHILVRFMAIRKPSEIKKSATIAIIWVTISLAASLIIAYLGRMIVAGELLPDGLQATVFIHLARRFFPPFLSGILLAAIIAASMSTADSQLLVASSSFTNDIYKPLIRKNASDKELVWVARGVVAVVAIIAYFLASARGEGAQAIMDMVENAWGLFGSAFGPVVLLSVFWKRFNYWGAVAGVVGGAVTDILWYNLLSSTTGVYELFPGFVVGMLCAVVVTLLTKAPSAEVVAIFDKATDPENDE
ncbi:MAG: sodium/proline symporter PutP [Acutalibacteraceae bacterium]|nr:sodium/proline symporter PutP [Clostridia bacterium]MEE1293322.1 sodium/proline symporter PutP [Acutalibacteraceae bacterium]NLD28792.1 sodium/proline symporter PutP [Clostridiales bacterium]MBQ1529872.1 sodium/proline symporter PutP [Clostridia bacterium]MBQ5581010.1 sodium/proline symporter PutP [Clostridia bacterium]